MDYSLIVLVGIIQSLILGGVLLLKPSFRYLGLTFLCCGLILLEEHLWQTELIYGYSFLVELLTPLSFAVPILLLFHFSNIQARGKFKWLFFLIPILAFSNFTPLYFEGQAYKICYIDKELLDQYTENCKVVLTHYPTVIKEIYFDVLLIIQWILLIVILIKKGYNTDSPRKYEEKFRQWDLSMIVLVGFGFLCTGLGMFFIPETVSFKSIFIPVISILVTILLVKESLFIQELSGSKSYSTIKRQEIEQVYLNIQQALQEEEVFTDSKMTLSKLAERAGVSSNKLSFVLNTQKTTFRELLNEVRIEKASKFLLTEESEQYSIEGISKKFGYQSKTTFYSNFKKYKQMTPSQYVKQFKK